MRIRKSLALAVMAPLALGAAALAPTAAHAAPGATVCVLVGQDHLDPGVHVNPTIPSSGDYTFVSSVLVCAGSLVGAATVQSTGDYTEALPLPTFSGSFSSSAFLIGGTCSGTVAGNRLGAVVVGTADVTCTEGFAGTGAVALVFQPDPTTLTGLPTDPVVNDVFMEGVAVFASLA